MGSFIRIHKKPMAMLAAVILLITVLCIALPDFTARAVEYNETDPELTFQLINSDVEESYGHSAYPAQGTFNQNDGVYDMKTNAYVAWRTEDDVGYAYRRYDIGGKNTDVMTFETTVTSMNAVQSGDSTVGLYYTASAGLMIRGGLAPDDPEIFLHCREGRVTIVYRSQKGGSTGVQYSTFEPQYPVQLRIEKKGTQYTCSFKTSVSGNWVTMRPVGANIRGPVYAGVSAHSCDPDVYIHGVFEGFSAVGSGTLDNAGETESETGTSSEASTFWEDPPAAENVLLRETFTDGSMTNEPASATNPVWAAPADENIITEESGNRLWYKNFASSYDYIGDEGWTDYETSLELQFTENCDPEINNIFALIVRHRELDPYGYYEYRIQFEYGNKINIYRKFRDSKLDGLGGTQVASVTVDNYLGDNKMHALRVSTLDNVITVYWDDQEVLTYTDNETLANLKGSIGILTKDTDVYIDNILVTKLEDPLGGDYDNAIGGNYNQPLPDYLQTWAEQSRPY